MAGEKADAVHATSQRFDLGSAGVEEGGGRVGLRNFLDGLGQILLELDHMDKLKLVWVAGHELAQPLLGIVRDTDLDEVLRAAAKNVEELVARGRTLRHNWISHGESPLVVSQERPGRHKRWGVSHFRTDAERGQLRLSQSRANRKMFHERGEAAPSSIQTRRIS
jgi:hypothetical protein